MLDARQAGAAPPRRGANYWGGYNAKDGVVAISANTCAGRVAVREVLGLHGMGDDDPAVDVGAPDFPAQATVSVSVSRWRRSFRTRTVQEWMSMFRAAGAPVAPNLLPEEVADDEQVHPAAGPERQVKPIVSF